MRGFYQPKAPLPKEDDLCMYFGVSKITVRRALADLKQQGLVERRHGRGTFVSQDIPDAHRLDALSFLDAWKKTAKETRVKVLGVEKRTPPGPVALQMRLDAGEAAVYCARLRYTGKTHLMVTEAWVPLALGKDITAADLRRLPLHGILLEQGVKFARVIEEVTAVSAEPTLAGLLQVEVGVPLIRVTRLIYDKADKPIQYMNIFLSPARSRVLLTVPTQEMQHMHSTRIVHDLVSPGVVRSK